MGVQGYTDTRIDCFENLEDGMTIDEVIEKFPVTREQVKAVLAFAARSLDASIPTR